MQNPVMSCGSVEHIMYGIWGGIVLILIIIGMIFRAGGRDTELHSSNYSMKVRYRIKFFEAKLALFRFISLIFAVIMVDQEPIASVILVFITFTFPLSLVCFHIDTYFVYELKFEKKNIC